MSRGGAHGPAAVAVVLLALWASCAVGQSPKPVAPGWTVPEAPGVRASIDTRMRRHGRGSLALVSDAGNTNASARQSIRAHRFRGKKIRLTGWIAPAEAPGGSALWLRIDMANGDYILDAMLELTPADARGRKWVRCELVADVPADALGISFGPRMKGAGRMWVDDLALAPAPASARITTIERRAFRGPGKDAALREIQQRYRAAPDAPVNLDFEAR